LRLSGLSEQSERARDKKILKPVLTRRRKAAEKGVTANRDENYMRLKDFEQIAILSTVRRLDPNAVVYLFGSRVDDTKKGGDIDLLVLSDILTRDDKRTIKIKLNELLGEQKIDIVLAADDSDPFVKLALETGVKL
jgi:uncharacterized protein